MKGRRALHRASGAGASDSKSHNAELDTSGAKKVRQREHIQLYPRSNVEMFYFKKAGVVFQIPELSRTRSTGVQSF